MLECTIYSFTSAVTFPAGSKLKCEVKRGPRNMLTAAADVLSTPTPGTTTWNQSLKQVVTLYRETNKWDSKLYKLKVTKQVNNASVTIARATIDLSELAQLNENSVVSDMQLPMKGTNSGNLHIMVKCTWRKQMDQRELQQTRSEVSDTDFEVTQSMKDVDVLVPVVEEEEPVELVKLKAAADAKAKAEKDAAEKGAAEKDAAEKDAAEKAKIAVAAEIAAGKAKVEAEAKASSAKAKAEATEMEAKAKATKAEAAKAEAEVKARAEAKVQADKDTMAKIYTDSEEARKKANADKAKLSAEAKAREELVRNKAQVSVKSRVAVFEKPKPVKEPVKSKKLPLVPAVAFIFAAVAAPKIAKKARATFSKGGFVQVAAEKKPRKSFFKIVEPEAEPVQAPVQEKKNLLQTLMDFLKEKSEKNPEKSVEAPKAEKPVEQPKPVEAVVGEERKVSLLGKAFAAPINGVKGAVSIIGSVGSKVVSAPAKGVKGAAGVVGSVGSKVLSPIKGAADAVGSTGSKLLSGPIKGVKAVRSVGGKVLSVPVKGAKGAAGVFGSVRSNVKGAPGKGLQGVKSACEAVGHGAAATGGAVGRVVRRIVKLPIVIVKLPANVLGGKKKKKTAAKAPAQTSGSREVSSTR